MAELPSPTTRCATRISSPPSGPGQCRPRRRKGAGTHQGSVDDAHLVSYLNEFVFRFNRRRSRSRGMVFYRVLELAVAHEPVRYQDLIATKRPRDVPPVPPQARGHPSSLERPPANRPWRTRELHSSG